MSRVFVSYRHDDSEADAGRLYDTLAAELGHEALYKDVENIAIGANWKRAVREALADSAVVLVVMGPDWRVSEAIAYELELVLNTDVPVVPVLVRKADLLRLAASLPAQLAGIGDRKAVTLSHASWSRDCRELLDDLKRVLGDPKRARVILEPPDPRALLDETKWPSPWNKHALVAFAQDLAECLGDPQLKEDAEESCAHFDEERRDEYRRRHDISPGLVETVRVGLERLSVERYALDLLAKSPSEDSWDAVADAVVQLGELLGDPSVGERARSEAENIRAELAELSATKGDSGTKANDTRAWPMAAFANTKKYGR